MKALILIAALFASFSVQAQWTLTAETPKGTWEIKNGSLELVQNRGDIPVAVVTGRTRLKRAPEVILERWYVALEDCRIGRGKLVTIDMIGDVSFENEFVFEGGNVASSIATVICGAAILRRTEQSKKGVML